MKRRSFLQAALTALASVFGMRRAKAMPPLTSVAPLTSVGSGWDVSYKPVQLLCYTDTGWIKEIDPALRAINTRCEPGDAYPRFPCARHDGPALSEEAATTWIKANFAVLEREYARHAAIPAVSTVSYGTNVDLSGSCADGARHGIILGLFQCQNLDDFARKALACAALLGSVKREKIRLAAESGHAASVVYLANWPFTVASGHIEEGGKPECCIKFSERGGAIPIYNSTV